MEMKAGMRILFVEDVPADQELAARELQRDGLDFVMMRVETRDALLDALEGFRPDLVITDFALPTYDGMQVLRHVQECDAHLPVIILTGSVNEETAVDCLKAGAADYILKEHLGRLPRAVREALTRKWQREDRQRAEDDLVRRTNEQNHYFERSTEYLAIFDMKGRAVRLNRRWETLLGVPLDELLGHSALAHVHVDDIDGMKAALGLLSSGEQRTTGTTRAHGAEDQWHWLEWSATREGDQIFFIAMDVTERIQAQCDLADARLAYEGILDSISEAVLVMDEAGRFLHVNHAIQDMYGVPQERLLGETPLSLAAPGRNDLDALWRHIAKAAAGAPQSFEFWGQRADGSVFPKEVSLTRGTWFGTPAIIAVARDISQRREVEEALRRSEQRLAEAIEMARLGHWEYDVIADRFTFNDQFYRVLGTTAAEVNGYTMSLRQYQEFFLHPDEYGSIEEENRLAQEAHNENYSRQVEQRILPPNGGEAWISVRTSVLKDTSGRTIRTNGIIQDITERRLAEAGLRETSHMLEEAQRLARIGTYSMDLVKMTWQGSAMLDLIFGVPTDRQDHSLEDWVNLVHPLDREEMRRYFLEEVLGKAAEFDHRYRVIRPADGSVRWVHGRGRLELDSTGRPVRMTGPIQDITELLEASEALRQSEIHYRQFFEHDLTADFIATADGRLLDCNPAFNRLFGFESKELALQCNVQDLYPNADIRQAMMDQLILERKLDYVEQELRDLQGEPLYVIMNLLGIFDDDGQLHRIQGYLFDITKHKLLQQQFYQAQKMESIGRLAGGVAHDFNNLLTVINGHVDLLMGQVLDQDPMRDHLSQIGHAGARAARLTRQLLAFSRRQVLRLEPVDLNAIVGEMERMLQRLIGEDVRLATELEPRLETVLADVGQLEQVVVNLAVNARDAMPDGGKLTITTRNTRVDEEFCRQHRPMNPGNYSLLEVTDTGTGMNRDTMSRIFEPFFTTKSEGKGTGLGLATVFGIVKQIGGYIWAESEVGLGSTFQIFLPCVTDRVIADRKDAGPTTGMRGTEVILVVEDEVMVRRLAVRMLSSHGYTVLEACDGREALELLQAEDCGVQLVLTDVIMPNMGGHELVEALNCLPRSPRFIYMSGYTADNIARHGILESGVQFLQKPFSMNNLLQKIREVLDLGSPAG